MSHAEQNAELRARYYAHLAERNQRIYEMYRAGAKPAAIARAFDISRITANRIVRLARREDTHLQPL